jgi:hypothetical protein
MNFCTNCKHAYKSYHGTPIRCLNDKAIKVDWDYVRGICLYPEPARVRGMSDHCDLWEPRWWQRLAGWARSVVSGAELY